MDFALFTLIGIAAAFAHLWIPGQHRVGGASAFVLGIAGAWNGAFLASAFVKGMMASLEAGLATAGSIVGAVGTIAVMEVLVEAYFRRFPDEQT